MFRKVIATAVVLTVLSTATYASVMKYTQEELDAANNLGSQWIINNHKNDPQNYNLSDKVLRQEIAAVARWVAKLEKKAKCDNLFWDLTATNPNKWACVNVEALLDHDLISKNTNFRPEYNITKSEAVAMLIKAIWFDYNYDSLRSDKNWQQQVVDYAAEKWVLENFTDYDTEATRWWIFKVADTTIKKDIEIKKKENPEKYSDEAF